MSRIRNAPVVFLLIILTIVLAAPGVQAATNCSAEFTPDYRIVVPYATYDGTAFSVTFTFGGTDNCSIWFNLETLNLINDASPFSGCKGGALLPDFTFHIPQLQINGTEISLDLQYMPVIATSMAFKVTGFNALASSSASDYVIEAGQTVNLASDLAINASGAVRIDGSLAPSTHTGQSITIIAEGNITITGTVAAGNGFPGGPGGSVTLHSRSGNITITDTASIRAGDGGSGTACTSQNVITAQGGGGGSISIKAPGGTLTLANKEGLLHIGNGGNSPEVKILGNDPSTTALPESGAIRPGNSGLFDMNAQVITGMPYQSTVIEKDFVDPTSGLPIYKKGDIINMPSSSSQFSGGKGGDAGAFIYGPGAAGASMQHRMALQGPTTAYSAGESAGTDGVEHPELVREGVNGGSGVLSGGTGQHIDITGKEGIPPGGNGQDAIAYGGAGGDCAFFGCKPGAGGNARAVGGKGAWGSEPSGAGGNGGDAYTYAGLSGSGGDLSGMHLHETIGETLSIGGEGGKGGGICPIYVDNVGGDGGFGGYAEADSNFMNLVFAKAEAIGGKAGDGGDGRYCGGLNERNGLAEAYGYPAYGTDGKIGEPGTTCPPLGFIPASAAKIADSYALTGTKIVDTCTNPSPQSIYNPSVIVSVNGNTVNFGSKAAVIGTFNPLTGFYFGTGVASDQTVEEIEGYFGEYMGVVRFYGGLNFKYPFGGKKDSCMVKYSAMYTQKLK